MQFTKIRFSFIGGSSQPYAKMLYMEYNAILPNALYGIQCHIAKYLLWNTMPYHLNLYIYEFEIKELLKKLNPHSESGQQEHVPYNFLFY